MRLTDCEGARRPLAEATTLPARYYTDAAILAAERELIFASEWMPVAREEDLAAPGDFVARDVVGEPVVVVRGQDGELRAFANVCRHRGTTVVEGCGNAKALQCPYHLWTYRLDGTLARAPGMEGADGFEPSAVRLPALGVETWQGWVFVNLDADAPPLGPRVTGLDRICAPYSLASMRRVGVLEYECEWNWKIVIENFAESYHHAGTHPQTLDRMFPGNRSWAEDNDGQPWCSLDHVSTAPDYEPFTASLAFPAHAFSIIRPHGLVWFDLDIRDVTSVGLRLHLFLAPDQADDPDIVEVTLAGLQMINDEDMAINRRTQHGLRSRFAEPGRISALEEATWQFRQWILQRLDGQAGEGAGPVR